MTGDFKRLTFFILFNDTEVSFKNNSIQSNKHKSKRLEETIKIN